MKNIILILLILIESLLCATDIPDSLWAGSKEAYFLLGIKEKEKISSVTVEDLKSLYEYSVDKINFILTQLHEENAPNQVPSIEVLQNIKEELKEKYLNKSLKVKTLCAAGLKALAWADLARVDKHVDPSPIKSLFSSFNGLRRLFKGRNDGEKIARIILDFSLEEIEKNLLDFPIIPLITLNGTFGVSTYINILSKGYVIVGLAIDNNSDVHGNALKSCQDWRRFKEYQKLGPKISEYEDFKFNSSIISIAHEFAHFASLVMAGLFTKDFELKTEFKNNYQDILNTLIFIHKDQKALILLSFYLSHEEIYYQINNTPEEFMREKFEKWNLDSLYIKNKLSQACTKDEKKIVMEKIKFMIEFYFFDLAKFLNEHGYSIPLNKDNPWETLNVLHDTFINAFKNAPIGLRYSLTYLGSNKLADKVYDLCWF